MVSNRKTQFFSYLQKQVRNSGIIAERTVVLLCSFCIGKDSFQNPFRILVLLFSNHASIRCFFVRARKRSTLSMRSALLRGSKR